MPCGSVPSRAARRTVWYSGWVKWEGRLQALVFDFDGTILDTESVVYQSWQEVYRAHGAELLLRDWSLTVGTAGAFDAVAHLERMIGRPVDRASLVAARRRRDQELLEHADARPGVRALVEQARSRELRLAVATSSGADWVEHHLSRLGLRDSFDAVCSFDDVHVGKPDPAVYRLALQRLRVAAPAATAIEDSPNGMLAARAAGIFCIAVPNAVTANFDFPQPDQRYESLEGIGVDDIEAVWSRHGPRDFGAAPSV